MKGVVLAGGKGTRLYPCTLVVNKHLIPIYDKPMIYYPLLTLKEAGCTNILVVTGGKNAGEFMELLKDGKQLGLNSIVYAYQENPTGGIAQALLLAEQFIGKDKFLMILGDNLILEKGQEFKNIIYDFMSNPLFNNSAKIFIKEVDNPSAFGVAEINDNNEVINIVEKPKEPKTNKAVIGLYLYDYNVFGIIKTISPSARGELEITDVNMKYVKMNKMSYYNIKNEWLDTGSFESLYLANQVIKSLNSN